MIKDYINKIKKRKEKNRISKKYQLVGLEVSEMLNDKKHKSLYMKLAKIHGEDKIFLMAKNVFEKKEIEKKGAYFMKILQKEGLLKKINKK